MLHIYHNKEEIFDMIKRAGEDGLSVEVMADRTGMNRRSVRNHIEQLKKDGLLSLRHSGWQRFWIAKENNASS